MSKLPLTIPVAIAAATLTAPSFAGAPSPYPSSVLVSDAGALAAMGEAYNASNANEEIGCVSMFSISSSPSVMCFATDASGNSSACTASGATASAFVQAVATFTSTSAILFEHDATGNCTLLQVYSDSYDPVK
jgi:hypothetical protein